MLTMMELRPADPRTVAVLREFVVGELNMPAEGGERRVVLTQVSLSPLSVMISGAEHVPDGMHLSMTREMALSFAEKLTQVASALPPMSEQM